MSDTHTALIAVDWGSSALRGARLNAAGVVLEEAAFPHGTLSMAPGSSLPISTSTGAPIALARATCRHTPDHSAIVRPSWVIEPRAKARRPVTCSG